MRTLFLCEKVKEKRKNFFSKPVSHNLCVHRQRHTSLTRPVSPAGQDSENFVLVRTIPSRGPRQQLNAPYNKSGGCFFFNRLIKRGRCPRGSSRGRVELFFRYAPSRNVAATEGDSSSAIVAVVLTRSLAGPAEGVSNRTFSSRAVCAAGPA